MKQKKETHAQSHCERSVAIARLSNRSAFTLAEGATHVDTCDNVRKNAFTLAEVLITLAIIGVVAAMTIPTLISSYKKKVVEVKLNKFNSIMTRTLKLSSIDNGDIRTWDISDVEKFYNTYLATYLKVVNTEKIDDTHLNIYLHDGTAFQLEKLTAIHLGFYPDASTLSTGKLREFGKNVFMFLFYPDSGFALAHDASLCNSPYLGDGTGFVPYFFYKGENDYWDSENSCRVIVYPTAEQLHDILMNHATYGCSIGGAYCTKLIQMNGWKIPDDYPFEF